MENSLIFKLLEKSQEAFILAIEIYNKPTIKYRVEGFSFLSAMPGNYFWKPIYFLRMTLSIMEIITLEHYL